jgi:hypothetical protein
MSIMDGLYFQLPSSNEIDVSYVDKARRKPLFCKSKNITTLLKEIVYNSVFTNTIENQWATLHEPHGSF